MSYLHTGLRGLGLGDDSALPRYLGMQVDCSNPLVWGLFQYMCGEYSPAAWRQMRAFAAPPMPVPMPAVDAGTSKAMLPYRCSDGSYTTAATNCPEFLAAVTAAATKQHEAESSALSSWADEQVPVADDPGGLSMFAWIALAVGVLGLAAMTAGTPRRYGP
jgi:hypothetical protein